MLGREGEEEKARGAQKNKFRRAKAAVVFAALVALVLFILLVVTLGSGRGNEQNASTDDPDSEGFMLVVDNDPSPGGTVE